MFTGIVEDIGTLKRVTPSGLGARLAIETRLPLGEVSLGDSIAVSGACLTVVAIAPPVFEAEISRETAARSTLGSIQPGTRVHLERALPIGGRLDGHLVLGHVDGVGRIEGRTVHDDSTRLEIGAPLEVVRYLVEKGSVAVHGVSLTVNELHGATFGVTIVPFTARKTFLPELPVGARVNLEADILGKYVERLLPGRGAQRGGLSMEVLARSGFLDG